MATSSPEKRAERARDWSFRDASLRRDGEIVIADGYGITIHVSRGQLIVHDGIGRKRRERRYGRVTSNISRLVVLGGSGSLSLEAVRWLTSVGAAIVCIDRDGRFLLTSTPTRSEARLRRAQALAPFNDTGLEVTRLLLRAKIAGQQGVAAELDAALEARQALQAAVEALDAVDNEQDALLAESDAALAYWGSWADVDIPFQRRDAARVPEHWRRFGSRTSRLGYGPRMATSPAGAILNYLYALLEAETRLACLTVGLDPALGVTHADTPRRDSLPLDLMEAVRPDVDRYLLALIRSRVFRTSDFYETQRGNCRLLAPLTHELAETLPQWRRLIGPVAEQVASMLIQRSGATNLGLPTPLTGSNRRADRARRHNRIAPDKPTTATPEKRCRRCGGRVPNQRRAYCDACLPHYQRDRYQAFVAAGQEAYTRRRDDGSSSAHGGQAAVRRAANRVRRAREVQEWEAAHPDRPDPSLFQREILPTIQTVPLSDLARATGLTLAYCALIRRGNKVPHPRHWSALRAATARDIDAEPLGVSLD